MGKRKGKGREQGRDGKQGWVGQGKGRVE